LERALSRVHCAVSKGINPPTSLDCTLLDFRTKGIPLLRVDFSGQLCYLLRDGSIDPMGMMR
jgi:hypothetical protein